MAEKGLISKSTMRGFADETRRLAEVTTLGTPAELLAILRGVELGSEGVAVSGTVTPVSPDLGQHFATGTPLPDYANTILLLYDIDNRTYPTLIGFRVTINRVAKCNIWHRASDGVETRTGTDWTVDHSTGRVTLPYTNNSELPIRSSTYYWAYVAWGD
jgi:hypothetical protein